MTTFETPQEQLYTEDGSGIVDLATFRDVILAEKQTRLDSKRRTDSESPEGPLQPPTNKELRFMVINGALDTRGVPNQEQRAIMTELNQLREKDGGGLPLDPIWLSKR